MKFIPLVLCVVMFSIASIGFFKTHGQKAFLYGACFMISLVCGILQLAIIF